MDGELLVQAARAPGRRPRPRAARRRRCAAPTPARSAARPRPGPTAPRRSGRRPAATPPGPRRRRRTARRSRRPARGTRRRRGWPPPGRPGADIEPAPWRSLPCSIAVRASSHSDAESADADPSTPSPTGAPAARSSATGASPLPRIMLDDGQCAAPTPRGAQPGHLVGVRPDDVRQPHPVAHPADVGEVVDRAPAEPLQAERVLVLRLAQVGVQPDVEVLGQLRGARHQRRRDAERGAGRQRDAGHRERRAVVVRVDQPPRLGEDLVVVLDDGVRRQPAVLHRQRHRAAGGVEAHAQVAGGGDLGGDQVAGAARGARRGGRSRWCSRPARAR